MENNDNSIRIERYLTEQMTPEENETFLNDLKNDKYLFEEAQMMALMIKEMKEEQAKQDSEIIEEVLATKKKAKVVKMIRWTLSIAAMFILIFGATHLYRMNQIDNLFNDYYKSYDISSARGSDDESIKKELSLLYNKVGVDKDLSPVITRLQTIYDNVQSNNEKYAEYTYYENDVAWYLALAYIKEHDLDKAKELLKPIADNGDEEAIKLLKAIESLEE